MVVADLEAGIGTLTRMGDGGVDVVVVVAEPTQKSLEVARRAADLADERSLGEVVVVANRLRSDDDLGLVEGALPGREVVAVPYDEAVEEADRRGASVLDTAPASPAVQALARLAGRLSPPPPGP